MTVKSFFASSLKGAFPCRTTSRTCNPASFAARASESDQLSRIVKRYLATNQLRHRSEIEPQARLVQSACRCSCMIQLLLWVQHSCRSSRTISTKLFSIFICLMSYRGSFWKRPPSIWLVFEPRGYFMTLITNLKSKSTDGQRFKRGNVNIVLHCRNSRAKLKPEISIDYSPCFVLLHSSTTFTFSCYIERCFTFPC